jgi:Skp family chaperone for outer membrane proteins
LEANRASYSPTRIKMEEQELNQSFNTTQLVLKELEDSLQYQMMNDQMPIQNLVNEAVTKVSERKKIDIVFNSAELNGYKTVMYSAKGMDITDEVLIEVIKLEKEKLKK